MYAEVYMCTYPQHQIPIFLLSRQKINVKKNEQCLFKKGSWGLRKLQANYQKLWVNDGQIMGRAIMETRFLSEKKDSEFNPKK